MRLSEHFTLEEMCYSDTARRNNIRNLAIPPIQKNLGYLCQNLLEPLRKRINLPIIVTSGYRCERLNQLVGGSPRSQHVYGQAADIRVNGLSPEALYLIIKTSGLVYDQLILEETKTAKWVHVSYTKHNRKQNLLYKNGKYTLD